MHVDPELLHALLRRALGTPRLYRRLSLASHAWDISGDCSDPIVLDLQCTSHGPEDRGRVRPILPAGLGSRGQLPAGGLPWISGRSENGARAQAGSRVLGTSPRADGCPGEEASGGQAAPSGIRGDNPARYRMWLDLSLRCRRCAACLQARRRLWALRAVRETAAAPQSVFVTLTYRPADRYERAVRAEVSAVTSGVSWREASQDERSEWFAEVCGADLREFWRRLRRRWATRVRYVAVCELHQDGWPHWHALVHRDDGGGPLTVSPSGRTGDVAKAWPLGFSKTIRVSRLDLDAPRYVAKYLGKARLARVRASLAYGNPPLWHSEEARATTRVPSDHQRGMSHGVALRRSEQGPEVPNSEQEQVANDRERGLTSALAQAVQDAIASYRPGDGLSVYGPPVGLSVTELQELVDEDLQSTWPEG